MKNLTIQINNELSSEGINKIREQCKTALSNGIGIIFDFSQTEIISDNVILLLFQIRDLLKDRQHSCSLSGLTDELIRFFSILGLHDTFALWGIQ